MKKLGYILFPVWVAFAGMTTGCGDTGSPQVDMIQIEGVSWACNVNSSYAIFGSSSESEELLEVTLPASSGDLLYMIMDDLQFYYRYNPEDDTLLSLSFDTLNTVSVYLNGKLEYMELSGSSSLEAFSQLSELELTQLSTIYFDGPVSDDLLRVLKKHEGTLSGKGLVVEGGIESESFYEILSLCQPTFLVIDDLCAIPDPGDGSCVSRLELLWVEGNIPALTKMSNCCSNLESLIIANWEPEPGEILPLAGLTKLQSITVAESELTSLANIEFPEALQRLHLISCDTLSDIGKLGTLQNLKHLSLNQCGMVRDMDVLLSLESLQRLSLPPKISQAEFEGLIEGLRQLEAVELIDCSDLTDLSPLQTLPQLNSLALQLEPEQLAGLESFKHLELLILTSEVFEDNPEWIKELRASLPNTKIVPGSGLCLGSGWLLLLLPFILMFRYFFRRKI